MLTSTGERRRDVPAENLIVPITDPEIGPFKQAGGMSKESWTMKSPPEVFGMFVPQFATGNECNLFYMSSLCDRRD